MLLQKVKEGVLWGIGFSVSFFAIGWILFGLFASIELGNEPDPSDWEVVGSSTQIGQGDPERSLRDAPDFILRVKADAGETTVTCLEGCKLLQNRSADNINAYPNQYVKYSCLGPDIIHCPADIAGWIVK